jgi:hypothetical protein
MPRLRSMRPQRSHLRRALALAAVSAVSLPASAQAVEAFDASKDAGIFEISKTWGANVHDFDRDGWRDVLISRHDLDARLYRNHQEGGFDEVQAGTFGPADRHGCAWADVNIDGLPDAFCALGGGSGVRQGEPDELWIQQTDGTFVDESQKYGIDGSYDRGRRATFINVNHDGYPDLYVGNGYPRADGQPSLNRLFINEGGTSYRDAPEYGLDQEVGGQSVQSVDYDADGWEDLLVCGQEGLRLFRNVDGERFDDVSLETRASGPCQAALLRDFDGDHIPDLARVAVKRMTVKLQQAGEFSSPVHARPLDFGQSLAAGDVDGDSDRDLYVLQNGPTNPDRPDERDLVLVNQDGLAFSRMRIPQTRDGRGDAVATIDFDRNGLSDFIVLNGQSQTEGPIRLVAFR